VLAVHGRVVLCLDAFCWARCVMLRRTASCCAAVLMLRRGAHACPSRVCAVLERQASAYFKGPDGSTPMMTAAFRSHAHVTRRLLLHQLKHREAPAFTSEKDLTDLQKARDEAPPIPEWSMEFRARTERSPRQPLALRPPPQLAPQLAQRGAPQL
jgi:hypothetical protein